MLQKSFGLDLVEQQQLTANNNNNNAEKSTGKYYLISLINDRKDTAVDFAGDRHDEDDKPLLMLILSFIYFNFGVLQTASLNNYLKEFGFTPTGPLGTTLTSTHFGPLPKQMESFVKQGYLIATSSSNNGSSSAGGAARKSSAVGRSDESMDWSWGPRARIEVPVDSLLSFLSELMLHKPYNASTDNNSNNNSDAAKQQEHDEMKRSLKQMGRVDPRPAQGQDV